MALFQTAFSGRRWVETAYTGLVLASFLLLPLFMVFLGSGCGAETEEGGAAHYGAYLAPEWSECAIDETPTSDAGQDVGQTQQAVADRHEACPRNPEGGCIPDDGQSAAGGTATPCGATGTCDPYGPDSEWVPNYYDDPSGNDGDGGGDDSHPYADCAKGERDDTGGCGEWSDDRYVDEMQKAYRTYQSEMLDAEVYCAANGGLDDPSPACKEKLLAAQAHYMLAKKHAEEDAKIRRNTRKFRSGSGAQVYRSGIVRTQTSAAAMCIATDDVCMPLPPPVKPTKKTTKSSVIDRDRCTYVRVRDPNSKSSYWVLWLGDTLPLSGSDFLTTLPDPVLFEGVWRFTH